jgi:hypothetical protein
MNMRSMVLISIPTIFIVAVFVFLQYDIIDPWIRPHFGAIEGPLIVFAVYYIVSVLFIFFLLRSGFLKYVVRKEMERTQYRVFTFEVTPGPD